MTQVTSPIGGVLDINNQDFLNAYEGKKILATTPQGQGSGVYYTIQGGKVFENPFDENIPNQSFDANFNPTKGLNPTSGSYATSEAFKYWLPTSYATAQQATSNFGMGTTPTADQYTGQTAGSTSGGTTLYLLKDGTVTSKAPPTGAASGGGQYVDPITGAAAPYSGTQAQADALKNANPTPLTNPSTTVPDVSQIVRAEWLGDATHPADVFVGTKAQIEAQARAAGINPANLYGTGFLTKSQTTTSTNGITTDSLSGQDKINLGTTASLTQTNQNSATTANTIVAGAQSAMQSWMNTLTPPETELDKQLKALTGEYNTALEGLAGRGTAQLAEEQRLGIPAKQQQIVDLTAELTNRIAEYNKRVADYGVLNQSIEGKAISMGSIRGQQGQVNKMMLAEQTASAADVGLLQARITGLQGQLTYAQDLANRAIDLKYADIQAEIDIKKGQIEALQPYLDKQEKIIAAAQQAVYDQQQTQLAAKIAQEKASVQFALENGITTKYYTYAGGVFRTADGYAFHSPEEFFADGGKTDYSNAPKVQLADTTEHSASYKEWQDYVSTGGTLNYNAYMTMDANRKKSTSSVVNNVYSQRSTYDGGTIPSDIKGQLLDDVNKGETMADVMAAYPEVDTSYIKSLYPDDLFSNPFK